MKSLETTRSLLLFVVLSLLGASCSGLGPVSSAAKVKYPNAVTSVMRAEFDQAENLYQRQQFNEAQQSYQKYVDSYAHNKLTDEAVYKQGKIFFLRKDFAGAARRFSWLDVNSPDPAYRSKANHMAGYAQYKNLDYGASLAALKRVEDPDSLPPLLRMQYYSLLITVAQSQGQDGDWADHAALSLFDLYEEQAGKAPVASAPLLLTHAQARERVEAWMARPLNVEALPDWIRNFPEGSAKGYVDYKIARSHYEAGNHAKARKLLTAFVNHYPRNAYYGVANNLLGELGGPDKAYAKKGKGEAFKVGVLLPMSGGQGGFGEAVLRGVRCAAGEGGACGEHTNVEVVVRDAGHDPGMIRQGIDDLKARGVSGVISILPGSLAVEAAMYATEKNLPLLIISQQEGLMQQGRSVFQMGLSPERQIHELVEVARDRGLKNFAVFYPSIPYGQKMADLFEGAVSQKGGRVVAKVAYDKQSPDVYAEARRLKTEIDTVTHNPSAENNDGSGVDAVFIPDTYQAINVIVPALEFNQVVGVTLIGTNTWNDPSLSGRIATNFPGSYFVDLYDATSTGGEVREFKQRFYGSFGSEPQVLSALGYDAMMMIRTAADVKGADRLGESLSGHVSYNGVTGVAGFKSGVAPIIRPKVISVEHAAAGL